MENAMDVSPNQLLTRQEAAEFLRVKITTLAKWAGKPGGPPMIKISRRCVRYEAIGLRNWLIARGADARSLLADIPD